MLLALWPLFWGSSGPAPPDVIRTHAETILAYVVLILSSTVVASGGVFRSRVEAFSKAELPAVVVRPGAEMIESIGRGVTKRMFGIQIEVLSRANPTQTADQVADAVRAAIHNALMADQTLGGRVARLIEGEMSEPELEDGDDTAGAVKKLYQAVYVTRAEDNTRLFHTN